MFSVKFIGDVLQASPCQREIFLHLAHSLFLQSDTHTYTHPDAVLCVCALLPQTFLLLDTHSSHWYLHTIHPHKKTHGDHNAAAAIRTASRMPVHKITMTRSRQKTVLFCIRIHAGHNACTQTHTHTHTHTHTLTNTLFTPHMSKWIPFTQE